MNYHDITDSYLRSHGAPRCPRCGQEMFPQDDHGRFTCFCDMGASFDVLTGLRIRPRGIPQVDTTGMTNEEKAKIAPINRLHSELTEAEAKLLELSARGPDCMDDPEYKKACEELEKERGKIS